MSRSTPTGPRGPGPSHRLLAALFEGTVGLAVSTNAVSVGLALTAGRIAGATGPGCAAR